MLSCGQGKKQLFECGLISEITFYLYLLGGGGAGPVGLVLDVSYRVLYMVKGAGHALKAGSEEELGKRIVVTTEGLLQGQ